MSVQYDKEWAKEIWSTGCDPRTTSFGISFHDLDTTAIVTSNSNFSIKSPEIHLIYNGVQPKRIIKNPEKEVTTVLWPDGGKTIVKRSPEDPDDDYFAVASAIAIHMYGSNSAFKRNLDNKIEVLDKPHKLPMWTDFQ